MSSAASPDVQDAPAKFTHKRWARLMPVVFVTYSLAYLDRSNFSIAVAGGMKEGLDITAGISALIGAMFFLGYFAFQIPGAIYAERRSVKKLIFVSLIAWGVLASVQGLLTSAWALIVVRFFVGAVEAAVLPAMVIFLSHWFTKSERGRANTFLILGNPVTVLLADRRLRLPDRGHLLALDVHPRGSAGHHLGLRLLEVDRRQPARREVVARGRAEARRGRPRRRAEGHDPGQQLLRGVPFAQRRHPLGAVLLVEPRHLRLRLLAAVDREGGLRRGDRHHRPDLGGPVRARRRRSCGSTAAPPTVRASGASSSGRGSCSVRWPSTAPTCSARPTSGCRSRC